MAPVSELVTMRSRSSPELITKSVDQELSRPIQNNGARSDLVTDSKAPADLVRRSSGLSRLLSSPVDPESGPASLQFSSKPR